MASPRNVYVRGHLFTHSYVTSVRIKDRGSIHANYIILLVRNSNYAPLCLPVDWVVPRVVLRLSEGVSSFPTYTERSVLEVV